MALQHGSNEWKPQNGMGLLVLRFSDDPETARLVDKDLGLTCRLNKLFP